MKYLRDGRSMSVAFAMEGGPLGVCKARSSFQYDQLSLLADVGESVVATLAAATNVFPREGDGSSTKLGFSKPSGADRIKLVMQARTKGAKVSLSVPARPADEKRKALAAFRFEVNIRSAAGLSCRRHRTRSPQAGSRSIRFSSRRWFCNRRPCS